jgi:CBS domain-containing protein
MGALLKIATCPASAVSSADSVDAAVRAMVGARVGAVAVVDGSDLVGIFTERDLMTKVVNAGGDASSTPVGDVMVRNPVVVKADTPRAEALEMMVSRHFRHLPVVGDDGELLGMLSIRDLLENQVDRLQRDVQSLEQYLGADGPGG